VVRLAGGLDQHDPQHLAPIPIDSAQGHVRIRADRGPAAVEEDQGGSRVVGGAQTLAGKHLVAIHDRAWIAPVDASHFHLPAHSL